MPPPVQASRQIGIQTPLGADALLLRSFSLHEALGRPFQIEAELASEEAEVAFDEVVGHPVTLRLDLRRDRTRHFHGIVSRLVQVANRGGYARYHATIVPWLWLLTRTADCRIFQNQTIPAIVEEVFQGFGFSDYELRLTETYEPFEFCVQYRETSFNFVSRLLEQAGIYYWFEHTEDRHLLVLADSISASRPGEGYESLDFRELDRGAAGREVVFDWTVEKEVQPVACALTDYDFTRPRTNLLSSANIDRAHGEARFEMFDYPGEYLDSGVGERLARVRIEELQAQFETLRGQTTARGLAAGATFSLQDHPRSDQNREYLVTRLTLQVDAGEFAAGEPAGDAGQFFSCHFTAIDVQQPFRPARVTPKPIVQGPQTAIVVGPSGDEIHTDDQARVKVHFHWDRHGEYDENASCFLRVSQPWAGKGWGSMATPRIGQEVIVDFLEGDPDRPIITGRVYNGDQPPPYGGGKGVVSGLKSNTHKGSGSNEMSMDDTAGKEKITIHAQYDMNTTVGHDQTTTVKNHQSITVESGNRTLAVKSGTNSETIKGNSSHTVEAGARAVKVTGGDYSATSTDAAVKLLGNGAGVEITGHSKGVTITGTGKGITASGTGGPGVKVDGDPNFEASGKTKASLTSPDVDIGDNKIKIHGSTSIELVVGGNSIKIDGGGVSISGMKIAISGASINASASGIHEIAGGVVKIN